MSDPSNTSRVEISDTGPRGQIMLRGDLNSPGISIFVNALAGCPVPVPLTARISADGRGAIWMSPDELLLLVDHGAAPALTVKAGEMLGGQHHLAVDMSDARVILRLTGAHAGEVLAKGAPCDLSDRGFPPGTARRTHLGGIAVGIWRLERTVWEVMAFRSYADHLAQWLEMAARPGTTVGFRVAPDA